MLGQPGVGLHLTISFDPIRTCHHNSGSPLALRFKVNRIRYLKISFEMSSWYFQFFSLLILNPNAAVPPSSNVTDQLVTVWMSVNVYERYCKCWKFGRISCVGSFHLQRFYNCAFMAKLLELDITSMVIQKNASGT